MPTFQAVISVTWQTKFKKAIIRDFPGGLGVKNSPFNVGDVGSIPGLETKIQHDLGQPSLSAATTEPANT